MGVCLSRCGDVQHKAGVVAATISHQNSVDLKTSELYDSNHSLKKFLHLYEISEGKKSLSSPRASLGESMQIPHSSELFSLPDSDAERSSCCISPSPARTSRASASSRATASPNPQEIPSVSGAADSPQTEQYRLDAGRRYVQRGARNP